MTKNKTTHVSEEKKKIVDEISKLIKSKNTILVASIKNLPASQFQEICKKLRGKAIVKVPKKNLIFRAIENSKDAEIKKLEQIIDTDVAVLFSDMDVFELAGYLAESKIPVKARPGQEAPEDIEIQPGPTSLPPGPAVSELGSLGIQIKIEGGKISIAAPKRLVKKGEKISQGAANIMSKLDIKPFSSGFVPLAGLDVKEKKLYINIKINKEETLKDIKHAFGKALPFAVSIGYPAKDTINFLIGKAHSHAKVLEKIDKTPENKTEGEENKFEN
jgi:large subunit ribosomal protein L10